MVLMYMVDVHRYCTWLAQDVLGLWFFHDSLFIVDICFSS
jgi:hypothetical protein